MNEIQALQARLAEYEKRERELQFRVDELTDFFENASLPLHWVDADGKIIWANQAELDSLGYCREEYIGRPIEQFHADPPVIRDILTRLINNETLHNYPARLRCKDGAIKHVLINSNVLRKEGRFIHTRCFTRDITDIRKEEERKNDFIAMVSHELKTPLTSLKSYIQILLLKARKEEDDFRINALTRADVQVKKMVSMIGDFLSLTRLEEPQIKLHQELFHLQSLAEEVVADARLLTEKHTINIKGCEAIIKADRDKIGQVLANLLSNAVKYSPDGGTITLGCEKMKGSIKIFVRDQGIGVSREHQRNLFTRFYRVENDKVRTVSGFGVGLYLVTEILRQHGSEIKMDSIEGKGSVFYFHMKTF
ncbi:PAS domain S-box protein [Flavihumibacter sp. R14]|nr:PAS domain S-box protein [Flavihumibacter soli]